MKHEEDGMQLAASLADFWTSMTLAHIRRRRRRAEEVLDIDEACDLAIVAALSGSAEEFRSLTKQRSYPPATGLIEAAERTRLRIPPLFSQMVIARKRGLTEQAVTWQGAFGALAALANVLEVMAGEEVTVRVSGRVVARS